MRAWHKREGRARCGAAGQLAGGGPAGGSCFRSTAGALLWTERCAARQNAGPRAGRSAGGAAVGGHTDMNLWDSRSCPAPLAPPATTAIASSAWLQPACHANCMLGPARMRTLGNWNTLFSTSSRSARSLITTLLVTPAHGVQQRSQDARSGQLVPSEAATTGKQKPLYAVARGARKLFH